LAKFQIKDNKELYINGYKVLKAWEGLGEAYWFGVEKIDDDIWFGYVRIRFWEWGYFSEAELKELINKKLVWELTKEEMIKKGGELIDSEVWEL